MGEKTVWFGRLHKSASFERRPRIIVQLFLRWSRAYNGVSLSRLKSSVVYKGRQGSLYFYFFSSSSFSCACAFINTNDAVTTGLNGSAKGLDADDDYNYSRRQSPVPLSKLIKRNGQKYSSPLIFSTDQQNSTQPETSEIATF